MNFSGAVFLSTLLFLALNGTSIEASTEDKESCKINRKLDEQCGSYTYKVVKPLLGYFKELRKEVDNQDTKTQSKDLEIKELKEQVAELRLKDNSNLAIIKELREQNEFHKNNFKELSNNLLSVNAEINKLNSVKCEEFQKEISAKSLEIKKQNLEIERLTEQVNSDAPKLQKCETDSNEINKNLYEKVEEISKIKSKLNNCEEKLKNEEQMLPNSCVPFGSSPGVHRIKTSYNYLFDVLCDTQTAGPGWTVIQQRINGKEDFYRDWDTYREGFGSFKEDFFLGLEKIHRLTTAQPHELYIHMEDFDGIIKYARYDQFAISGEDDKYRLKLGVFSGNTIDELEYHKNNQFSTFDRDNDKYDNVNCAELHHGGWWYFDCATSKLNGKYNNHKEESLKTNFWGCRYSLKTIKMLIHVKN